MADLVEFLKARLGDDERDWRIVDRGETVYQLRGLPLAPRMLAEVEAKRRIIELHREWWTSDQNHCVCDEDECIYPCETLRLLALPYADHSDYRPEWRP